jgi:hypothetical protein
MTYSTSSDTPHDESPDVQISGADLALATELAQNKGMDVEIYLRTLIHDELTRQANFQPTDPSRAEGSI